MSKTIPHLRHLSLRRTINTMVLAGYCSILILLLILDYYLIGNYQLQRKNQEEAPLNQYIELITDEMTKAKKLIYDIYVFDNNFSVLTGETGSAEKFSNAYDLRKSLESYMAVDENLHGFYIFYDKAEAPLYHINTDRISSSCASTIGSVLRLIYLSSEENQVTKWTPICIENNLYLIIPCHKGNVSVFCVLNVTDAIPKITSYSTFPSSVSVVHDGEIIGNSNVSNSILIKAAKAGKDKIYIQSEGNRIYGSRIPDTSIYVFQVYKSGIESYLSSRQLFLLVFTALSVLAAIWLVYKLKKNLITPLAKINRELDRISVDEHSNIGEIPTCFEELEKVTDTIHTTITKLEKQKMVSYEHFIEKQKAQMQYLQIQVQPHFYLNGLKVISALVYSDENEKAQTYILGLSEHMRYLMQVELETTTLINELEFTRNYISLRNQMSQRVIHLNVQIDEKAKNCLVPTLLVQTFVDNSIKHAKFGNSSAELVIDVRIDYLITEDGDFLDVQIHDNGCGYDNEYLKILSEEPKAGEKHIGISNLRRRSKLMYGEKAEFSFYNDNGAISECIIPVQERRNEYNNN